MLYHSNGAFTHDDLYNMPIYLRRFYLRELENTKEQEKKNHDKAMKKSKGISRPGISPK